MQSSVKNMVQVFRVCIPLARTRLFSAFTAAFGLALKLKEEEERKKAKVKKEEERKRRCVKVHCDCAVKKSLIPWEHSRMSIENSACGLFPTKLMLPSSSLNSTGWKEESESASGPDVNLLAGGEI